MRVKPDPLTLSGRIYSLLLHAYPAPFRREYGHPMAQLFRDDVRATLQESGTAGLISLWFLTLYDLLKTAFAEHIWEVFHMPMEKLQRWSGPAAVLFGTLWLFLILVSQVLGADLGLAFIYLFVLPAGLLLLVASLFGLYRRLPVSLGPVNRLVFGLALAGALVLTTGTVGLLLVEYEIASAVMVAGILMIVAGVTGMGLIAFFKRALGPMSFVPLFQAVALLGLLGLLIIDNAGNAVELIFLVLAGLGWFLLGFALWSTREDAPGPALPA